MKTYRFNNQEDWYTAQRILGALNISYNDFENNGIYIIEVLG